MPVETMSETPTDSREWQRLSLDDKFVFRCDPELDCFTKCCRDVTIVLTPYDILRLKRALGMSSSDFLEAHTLTPCFPSQKFPLVILKMEGQSKQCPFLSVHGCSVYKDRPWSCRMYPLGTAEPKQPTAEAQPFHFVVIEDVCQGHRTGKEISVRDWMVEQGAEEYEAMSTSFKELTLHDFWNRSEDLSPAEADMFYMACYDVDRFRRFLFETRFLCLIEVDEARVEAIATDDEELLEFAMQWLRFSLFRERTMKVRRSAGEKS